MFEERSTFCYKYETYAFIYVLLTKSYYKNLNFRFYPNYAGAILHTFEFILIFFF